MLRMKTAEDPRRLLKTKKDQERWITIEEDCKVKAYHYITAILYDKDKYQGLLLPQTKDLKLEYANCWIRAHPSLIWKAHSICLLDGYVLLCKEKARFSPIAHLSCYICICLHSHTKKVALKLAVSNVLIRIIHTRPRKKWKIFCVKKPQGYA